MATSERIPSSIRRGLAWLFGTGGSVVLVVLLARTAVGAVDARLAPWAIATLSAIGFSLSMTIWRLVDADGAAGDIPRRLAGAAAGWLAGLLFGLLIAGTSAAGTASVTVVALTWAAAIACRLWRTCDVLRAGGDLANRIGPASDRLTGVAASPATVQLATRPAMTEEQPNERRQAERDGWQPSLQMNLRRHATPDAETIEITARLEFPSGAREAVLHVPFWPALASPPLVECEPLEGDEIDMRVTAAECYGIRIAGRLPTATAAPRTVLIGVEVQAAAANGGSAAAA